MKKFYHGVNLFIEKRKMSFSILAVVVYLVGITGFLSNLLIQSNIPVGQFEMTKKLGSIHGSSVVAVDNDSNYYISSNLRPRIQVYDSAGIFKFAYLFNSTSSISTYYIDDENKIHILFSRPLSKMIISNGQVEMFENIIDNAEIFDKFEENRAYYELNRNIEIIRNKEILNLSIDGMSKQVRLESTLFPLGVEFWGVLMMIGTLLMLFIHRKSLAELKRKYAISR
ncbi:hypothetical protein [Fusibacter sp. 3D3]|uniref:hypothetical protein n=1 Tax=Fusibacter sp. 3D3 TaxID=1048380 RepID=UPI0008535D0B|nr:hypothetical protein [Fusibacter sp. 3D3]GAU76231.1 hypothetical protein F3D3_0828 [Fusibacter sp. 3D3]